MDWLIISAYSPISVSVQDKIITNWRKGGHSHLHRQFFYYPAVSLFTHYPNKKLVVSLAMFLKSTAPSSKRSSTEQPMAFAAMIA